jgi:ABC-2 type transport system ATP-binding protein
MNAIDVISLSKIYGDLKAVDEISFKVKEDEIFGFLGPNGAGKSTTMMILTTLLKPTSGSVFVSGHDVVKNPKQVRANIGYVQQESTVDEFLTGRENLLFQAKINHIPHNTINRRIDDMLDIVELTDKQNDIVITYSGGMRKRLDIAGGLLHMPKVLFLDEPTVGLDIQTRRKIWNYVRNIHDEYNMTIFLSTHYMEEADKLCDRIGIIDHGKIQNIDTPQNMKDALGNEIITFIIKDPQQQKQQLISALQNIPQIKEIKTNQNQITVFTSNGSEIIPQIFQLSINLQIKITSLSLTKPTLDDVFISYTGHELREEEPSTYNRKKEHSKMKRLRA